MLNLNWNTNVIMKAGLHVDYPSSKLRHGHGRLISKRLIGALDYEFEVVRGLDGIGGGVGTLAAD